MNKKKKKQQIHCLRKCFCQIHLIFLHLVCSVNQIYFIMCGQFHPSFYLIGFWFTENVFGYLVYKFTIVHLKELIFDNKVLLYCLHIIFFCFFLIMSLTILKDDFENAVIGQLLQYVRKNLFVFSCIFDRPSQRLLSFFHSEND